MPVGRNEPCPCGSGKKFKRCCAAPPPPRERTADDVLWQRFRLASGPYKKAMARFVESHYEHDIIDDAWAVFIGSLLDPDDFLLPVEFSPESPVADLFVPWFQHRWKPLPVDETDLDKLLLDRSPTEAFLSLESAKVEPLITQYLRNCLEAWPSYFEAVDVNKEHGFRVRDLVTESEHYVHEYDSSRVLRVGEILFAQIVPLESISLMEAAPPFALPATDREMIAAKAAALSAERSCARRDVPRICEVELRELFFERLTDLCRPALDDDSARVKLFLRGG